MVSFTPRPLYPRERAPGTHCIGGWVDPRAGLDNMEKGKPKYSEKTCPSATNWTRAVARPSLSYLHIWTRKNSKLHSPEVYLLMTYDYISNNRQSLSISCNGQLPCLTPSSVLSLLQLWDPLMERILIVIASSDRGFLWTQKIDF
jgi:hypothetical protein